MPLIDDILERFGLKYEDLSVAEKDTLNSWMETLSKNQLTLEGIKGYIANMKESVEEELAKTGHDSKQDLFLKARLRNYMLLEAFLSTPERAKRVIENQIAGIASRKS